MTETAVLHRACRRLAAKERLPLWQDEKLDRLYAERDDTGRSQMAAMHADCLRARSKQGETVQVFALSTQPSTAPSTLARLTRLVIGKGLGDQKPLYPLTLRAAAGPAFLVLPCHLFSPSLLPCCPALALLLAPQPAATSTACRLSSRHLPYLDRSVAGSSPAHRSRAPLNPPTLLDAAAAAPCTPLAAAGPRC